MIHHHDVLIIGGGLTGLRAALRISDAGLDGAVVSKVHPLRSHSVAGRGDERFTVEHDTSGEATRLLSISSDVTALKQIEEALKQAERLAGIGETAAMIGHDLRNPLQGLHYIVDLQKLRFERIRREHRGVDDWKNEEELFEALASRSSTWTRSSQICRTTRGPSLLSTKRWQSAPLSTTCYVAPAY